MAGSVTVQGTCGLCGGPLLWDGEQGSCPCGASTVTPEFVAAARGPSPEEAAARDRAFQISCEAEEMVARNPRWLAQAEGDTPEERQAHAINAAAGVATRAYDQRHAADD